jgi:hypothetical protein
LTISFHIAAINAYSGISQIGKHCAIVATVPKQPRKTAALAINKIPIAWENKKGSMKQMKASIVLLTGSVVTMAESEFNRIKKAVKSAPSASVVTLNFVDEEGTEHLLPFSSVGDLKLTAEERNVEDEPREAMVMVDLSVKELKEYLDTSKDLEAVQRLLDQEKTKEKPRESAVKLLEDRITALSNDVS